MPMSATEFVEGWIRQNVNAEPFVGGDEDRQRAKELAAKCLSGAEAEGIARAAIRQEYDDLEDRIFDAMGDRWGDESDRLAGKDT